MANRSDVVSVVAIAGFTLITACAGLYLGFVAPRVPPPGKPVPRVPDQGSVLYGMTSLYSQPDRVRLEWREMAGATGYRVTIMTAEDESLFVSPLLSRNSWVISGDPRLTPQTLYHWRLSVLYLGRTENSDVSAFATQ